jgi:hypothetical protein
MVFKSNPAAFENLLFNIILCVADTSKPKLPMLSKGFTYFAEFAV